MIGVKEYVYKNATIIKLPNRRVIVETLPNGKIGIATKNLIKGREIHETKTLYTREGAESLFMALKRELSR